MVSATALTAPGPAVILTSDPDDIAMLCGPGVTVWKGPGAQAPVATRRFGSLDHWDQEPG